MKMKFPMQSLGGVNHRDCYNAYNVSCFIFEITILLQIRSFLIQFFQNFL